MNTLGFIVGLLTKYIAVNRWKPEEGNDLKSIIMGILLGKTQNCCIFTLKSMGREAEFYH